MNQGRSINFWPHCSVLTNKLSCMVILISSGKLIFLWIQLLTSSSHCLPLGLRMDDNTIRVVAGLCLGSTFCHPHAFQHCEAEEDHLATYGLSCTKRGGCHHHHSAINDILYHALLSALAPSRLDPSGLLRLDGKRPDGITMIPWRNGKFLVWDTTCPDTSAQLYHDNATRP